ncbi:MAG: hypothetical protein WBA62_03640 [Xanthobacteraceae bacterium]
MSQILIDWRIWRAAREKPADSWLKRQMAERKEEEGTVISNLAVRPKLFDA